MEHQLQKLDSLGYRCQKCLFEWKGKPRGECPELPCYHAGNKPQHLLLRSDLMPRNLKPKLSPVAYYIPSPSRLKECRALYNESDTVEDIPNLPPIYTWSNRPDDLHTTNKLYKWNLKPGSAIPAGCIWDRTGWTFLYRKEDCAIANPDLPPCYDYSEVPPGLYTCHQLKKEHLDASTSQPRCCYRFWDKDKEDWVTVLLYHPDDCNWKPRDRYITKTTLKLTYLLSASWIKRIGKPDLVEENPHHHKFSDMQLYSKQRVEAFLADNAEEYALWLDERDRYLVIFELNRKKIEAGQQRLREKKQRIREQQLKCLRCASGCATPKGFLCAIHPLGLDEHQIPCADWTSR